MSPVVVPTVPDYLGGVISRLRAYDPLIAKIGPQLAASLGAKWTPLTSAVLVRRVGAGAEDVGTGRFTAWVDTFWYGPSEYEAVGLWNMTHYWLCPDGRTMLNTYRPGPAGLLFDQVEHMAGPSFLVEAATNWPYVFVRYLFTFSGTPI